MLAPRATARRRAAAGIAAAAGLALGAASTAAAAPVGAASGAGAASAAPAAPTVSRTTRSDTHRLQIHLLGVSDHRVRLTVATAGATDYDVHIVVRCATATIASGRLATAGPRRRTVSLTVRPGVATRGRLTVDVTALRHPPVAQTTS